MDKIKTDKNGSWFDSNFRRYYQALCYFALNYLKDQDAAEDIVQGVFINLLDQEEHFESEEHLKHYLYKAVRNASLNELKLTAIHSGILEKLQNRHPQEEEIFFTQVVRSEVYRYIQEAVQELPTECGRIFKLAYLEHLDNPEIAQQLHISINTVKVQKNKAKHLLRAKLKDLYPLIALLAKLSI